MDIHPIKLVPTDTRLLVRVMVSSVPNLVQHILGPRIVPQVAHVVIKRNSVIVADLKALIGDTKEGARDQTMDTAGFSIYAHDIVAVSVLVRLQSSAFPEPRIPGWRDRLKVVNTSHAA